MEAVALGRLAVDDYRREHEELYEPDAAITVSERREKHAILFDKLKADLVGLGFPTPYDFWRASREVNIAEMGFASVDDFNSNATAAQRIYLRQEKWR